MLVEGVDFARDLMSLEDAGWRAMAANVSDIAAMGARSRLATVALGVAGPGAIDDVLECYRGIAAAARHWKLDVAGGDLSRAPAMTIAITVVGEVRPTDAKRRDGGRPGDILAVTGPLGSSRAGLELARNASLRITGDRATRALEAFRRPRARLAAGRFLGASRNVGAMMDCSDGLAMDLPRLCASSRCGALLQSVPVAPAAAAVAEQLGEDPERFTLAAGEDYALIVAVRKRAFGHLAARYRARFGEELIRIGVLREEPGVTWNGAPLERSGWDHFAV